MDASLAKKKPHLKKAMAYDNKGVHVQRCIDGCFEELDRKTNPHNTSLVLKAGARLRAKNESHPKPSQSAPREITAAQRIAYADEVINGPEAVELKANLLASHRTGLRVPTRENLLVDSRLSPEQRARFEREWDFTDMDNLEARKRLIELVVEASIIGRAYKNLNAALPIVNHFLAPTPNSIVEEVKKRIFETSFPAHK